MKTPNVMQVQNALQKITILPRCHFWWRIYKWGNDQGPDGTGGPGAQISPPGQRTDNWCNRTHICPDARHDARRPFGRHVTVAVEFGHSLGWIRVDCVFGEMTALLSPTRPVLSAEATPWGSSSTAPPWCAQWTPRPVWECCHIHPGAFNMPTHIHLSK